MKHIRTFLMIGMAAAMLVAAAGCAVTMGEDGFDGDIVQTMPDIDSDNPFIVPAGGDSDGDDDGVVIVDSPDSPVPSTPKQLHWGPARVQCWIEQTFNCFPPQAYLDSDNFFSHTLRHDFMN